MEQIPVDSWTDVISCFDPAENTNVATVIRLLCVCKDFARCVRNYADKFGLRPHKNLCAQSDWIYLRSFLFWSGIKQPELFKIDSEFRYGVLVRKSCSVLDLFAIERVVFTPANPLTILCLVRNVNLGSFKLEKVICMAPDCEYTARLSGGKITSIRYDGKQNKTGGTTTHYNVYVFKFVRRHTKIAEVESAEVSRANDELLNLSYIPADEYNHLATSINLYPIMQLMLSEYFNARKAWE